MGLDGELQKMAMDLQDTLLLARISGGDLVALEAKYHYNCLSSYKSQYRSLVRSKASFEDSKIEEKLILARAFAELVCYVESNIENGDFIFKMSQLHDLFENRLISLGVEKSINPTRLKRQLLEHFSGGCQEQQDGNKVLLVFNEGFKKLLKESMISRDLESEAIAMTKLVKVIRHEIFNWRNSFTFSGSFPPNCQLHSVPTVLKTLISMMLNGPNVQHQGNVDSQACLTLSQLLYFNVKSGKATADKSGHLRDREPPLPLYIGLSIHTQTRSKKIINSLYRHGISVNYNRMIELENLLATAICEQFEEEGVVCPAHLRKGLFTVGALDNIDHNLSSTTSQGSFHGTGISIFQFPTVNNSGSCRDPVVIQPNRNSTGFSLPENYTNISAVTSKTNELTLPDVMLTNVQGHLKRAKSVEDKWIEHSLNLLTKEKLEKVTFFLGLHSMHQHNLILLTLLL